MESTANASHAGPATVGTPTQMRMSPLRLRWSQLAAAPWPALRNIGLFCAALVAYLEVNIRLIHKLPTTGDEPWYLLQTYTLIHYHTSNLAAVIQNHHIYSQFLGLVPDDHTQDYLGNGERVLPNLPGYAALIAPFYVLHGRSGIVAFQAVLAAFTVVLLFNEARRLYDSCLVGSFASLAYLLSLPAVLYVGQVFPSTVASCATFLGFVLASRRLTCARGWRLMGSSVALGLLLFMLPWLHFKYAAVALGLLVIGLLALRPRLPRLAAGGGVDLSPWYAAATLIGLVALSFVLIGLYSRHYYGTLVPQVTPYQEGAVNFQHADLQRGVHLYVDIFLSAQNGLLPWVPLDLLVLPGLVLLWCRSPRRGIGITLVLLAQLGAFLTVVVAPYVYQGWALPSRFTVESAPFLALCVAGVFAVGEPVLRTTCATLFGLRLLLGAPRKVDISPRRSTGMVVGLANVGRMAFVLGCVALLVAGGWFARMAVHDPLLLYGSPAGVRLAAKYPQALPAWWFALFPQTPGVVEYSILFRDTVPLDTGGQSQWVDIPSGQFVATFTITCTATRGPAPVLSFVVESPQRIYPHGLAERVASASSCSGAAESIRVAVPFTSDGYDQARFAIASTGSMTVTSGNVSYVPASAHH
jgi:hypothetical protein